MIITLLFPTGIPRSPRPPAYTDPIQTLYRPYTDPIQTLYRPYTDLTPSCLAVAYLDPCYLPPAHPGMFILFCSADPKTMHSE